MWDLPIGVSGLRNIKAPSPTPEHKVLFILGIQKSDQRYIPHMKKEQVLNPCY